MHQEERETGEDVDADFLLQNSPRDFFPPLPPAAVQVIEARLIMVLVDCFGILLVLKQIVW